MLASGQVHSPRDRVSPELQQVLPKYVQVADYIRDLILRGELRPGDEIPSERRIVDEWGISRPTATRALAALRAEGLVEARQGSGTFVREQPRMARRARDRYVRGRATGQIYTAGERSEITDAGLLAASEEVATALGITVGAEAVRRRRVVFDETGPVEVSSSWFAESLGRRAPKLLERARIREGTIGYIERMTGRRARTGRDRISARLATREEASALDLGGDGPAAVLVVHHTAFDAAGEPIEFAEAVFPPGRWSFEDEYPISG
jgi:DNA-binding GntR family transcriptional regulator